MNTAADLWMGAGIDPTACVVCGRDSCEEHVVDRPPQAPPGDRAIAQAFTLDELLERQFAPRRPILTRGETVVFREGHLGQAHALRGVGKTWFMQTVALVAAAGGDALGFSAPEPSRVLYVDGEMDSQEIQGRFGLLRERMAIPAGAPITVVAADWQPDFLPRIDTVIGQDAIEPHVDGADLIILDNRSCLFDPEGEKDPTAWQPTQDWLLSLRRRGKAVLMAHHSNRLGGARGHSKAEDLLNLIVSLTRPEDYTQDQGARFLVTFDKCRGAHGAAVAPFVAPPHARRMAVRTRRDESRIECR